MKNILIVSEHDKIEGRLILFIDGLFSFENKNIYLCNIDLVDCRVMKYHYPSISEKSKILSSKLGTLGINVFDHSAAAKEKLHANCCDDINKIIQEKEINCVVLPIFINDEEHWAYYKLISKEIKKAMNIEIVGLVID